MATEDSATTFLDASPAPAAPSSEPAASASVAVSKSAPSAVVSKAAAPAAAVSKSAAPAAAAAAPNSAAAAPATAATKAAAPVPAAGPAVGGRGPEIVWYPHAAEDEWSPCQLVSRDPGGGATLKIQRQNVVIVPEKAHLICPRDDHNKDVQNLASLRREGLGAEDIEDAIRSHFCSQLPYTNIDNVTLFVNPFRELPIHDGSWIEKYSAMDESLPPHIYNAAAKAYSRGIEPVKQNQVIFLLGEACAGKSRAFGHLLGYFAQTSGDGDDDLVGKLLGLVQPLISVHCQCGKAGWSSTRALLSVELGLAADGFLARSAAKVELLEAGRAAREQGAEGFGFEALYLAGKDPSAKSWLGDLASFRILGEEEDIEDYDGDGKAAEAWSEAMEAFGLDMAEVVRIICGILLLGEIEFADTQAGPSVAPKGALDAAAKALGVQASALSQALLADAGSAGGSQEALTALLEALHRRLVAWILQQGNSKLVGEGEARGNAIRIVEVPAMPNEADLPGSFDMLGLQWLAEAVQAELLTAARRGGGGARGEPQAGKLEDLCDASGASEKLLGALAGLAAELVPPPATAEKARDRLKKWAQDQAPDVLTPTTAPGAPELGFRLLGTAGAADYAADGRLASGAAAGAGGKVVELLSRSSFRPVAELCAAPAPAAGLEAAQRAVESVRATLRGEGGERPWLVCCLRPNEKGSKEIASKPVMLRQVRGFRLADVAHLSEEQGYSILWPLHAFRRQYGGLAPSLSPSAGDFEVCQLIVKSAGSGQGTVGQENVYGTAMLRQLLDAKLRELEQGSRSEEEKLQAMSRMMDQQQDQRAQQEMLQSQQLRQREELEKLQRQQQADLESFRSQFENQQQQQQQEALERLQGRQREELERLLQQRQPPPGEQQPAATTHGDQERPAAASPSGEAAGSPRAARRSPRRRQPPEAPAGGGGLGAGGQGPPAAAAGPSRARRRAMAEGRHAALHAKLSQMAAVLRVAKARERRALREQGPRTEEIELLRQERDAWKEEAERLWRHLQDLQNRLLES